MGNKIYQLFEYAYIAMAIFSIYLVITNWETDRGQAYLFSFFGVLAIFMYFFKRRFRKKFEKRKGNQ
jgi:hypothetical protein